MAIGWVIEDWPVETQVGPCFLGGPSRDRGIVTFLAGWMFLMATGFVAGGADRQPSVEELESLMGFEVDRSWSSEVPRLVVGVCLLERGSPAGAW